MKTIPKILLSLFLFFLSFLCFFYMPSSKKTTGSVTINISSTQQQTNTIENQYHGISKFLEWVGFGFLVLALWIWRDKIGFNKLGPFGGPEFSVSQQPAGLPPGSPDEAGPPPTLDLENISNKMNYAETRQQLQHIMELFQKTHSISVRYVADKLRVPQTTAKTLLYYLTENGQLRADGFPVHTIYTPANSLENLILDAARNKLAESHNIVLNVAGR